MTANLNTCSPITNQFKPISPHLSAPALNYTVAPRSAGTSGCSRLGRPRCGLMSSISGEKKRKGKEEGEGERTVRRVSVAHAKPLYGGRGWEKRHDMKEEDKTSTMSLTHSLSTDTRSRLGAQQQYTTRPTVTWSPRCPRG